VINEGKRKKEKKDLKSACVILTAFVLRKGGKKSMKPS